MPELSAVPRHQGVGLEGSRLTGEAVLVRAFEGKPRQPTNLWNWAAEQERINGMHAERPDRFVKPVRSILLQRILGHA